MAFDNKQITRRFIEEVWNTGNLALVDELVDPSYEGRDPVVGTYKRDALKQTIEGYRKAFPDLKLEIVHLVAELARVRGLKVDYVSVWRFVHAEG